LPRRGRRIGSTTSVEGVSDDNVVVSLFGVGRTDRVFGVGRTDRVRAAAVSTAAPAVARLGALADAAAVNGAEHAAMEEQPDRLQQRRRQEPAPEPQRAKLEVRLAPFDGAWNGKFGDVHVWLREFQYELDIHQWPDPARAMRSFLIGAALEFVINLDADVKNDYDALVASLRQRFAPVNYNEMVYQYCSACGRGAAVAGVWANAVAQCTIVRRVANDRPSPVLPHLAQSRLW
jgi:hypothetical protein